MASGSTRTRGVIQLLDRYHIDVVGLQEFQRPQARTFRTEAGATYATYSPPGDTENTIAWRRTRWEPLAADTVAIPYFDGHTRRMPMVRLRDRATGREIEVVNVHNPADTSAYPHQASYRTEAVDRETWLLRQITAREQIPVMLTGDLNDRHDVFCRLTRDAAMTSAAGGTNTGGCRPPAGAGIDWIFGNHGVQFRDQTVVKGSLVRRTSDHPFVVTRARTGPAQ
jgi:endonuclease/exonuclease/phosphatase family metal-dependent hydrolase